MNNILKITALSVCMQAPLVAMNFRQAAIKTKPHNAKSIKRHTVTSPKLSDVCCSEHILHTEPDKKSWQDVPLEYCIYGNMLCPCIKKYEISTNKALEFVGQDNIGYNHLSAKGRLDNAIDLFKNNPDVALNLTDVRNNLCHKLDKCYDWAVRPTTATDRGVMNGFKLCGLLALAEGSLNALGLFNTMGILVSTAFFASGIPFIISDAMTDLTQEEKIRLGVIKYHLYKETDHINYALAQATAKKEQL